LIAKWSHIQFYLLKYGFAEYPSRLQSFKIKSTGIQLILNPNHELYTHIFLNAIFFVNNSVNFFCLTIKKDYAINLLIFMEKRSSDRVPASVKIKLCLDNDINTGTLVNLSRNGMLINTKVCFPLKSQFDILLPSGDEILKIPVKVSRLLKKDSTYDGIGVVLLNPSSRYFEFLDNQLKGSTITDKKIKTYVCTVCNHVAFGQVPIICPFCNGSIDNFYDNTGEINTLSDFQSLADFEKKHFPLINIARGTNQAQDGGQINVHVTIGEIQHKMDIDDRITFIDFYFNDLRLNKKCLARVNLNCHIVNPDATIRFHEAASGTLTVVSNCNAHGSWMAETTI